MAQIEVLMLMLKMHLGEPDLLVEELNYLEIMENLFLVKHLAVEVILVK